MIRCVFVQACTAAVLVSSPTPQPMHRLDTNAVVARAPLTVPACLQAYAIWYWDMQKHVPGTVSSSMCVL